MDDRRKDWHREIDLDNLSLSRVSDCILGQLYGTYMRGADTLDLSTARCIELGFCAHPDAYAELNRDWRHEVELRLALDRIERTVEVELA